MKRIVATDGAYLFDEDGARIFDAISSWWVTTHGHRHPVIMDAIREATETYDQIIFAEFTHEPAEILAKGLLDFAPEGLSHVFTQTVDRQPSKWQSRWRLAVLQSRHRS